MPQANKIRRASAARMVHRRYQTAKSQRSRDHALTELENVLNEATARARGTLTRTIGAPTEADQIMVYAFGDDSILIIPLKGLAFVARNQYDREHFGRMLEEQRES